MPDARRPARADSQLEAGIERLAEMAQGHRKIILIARAAIVIAVLMLATAIFGLIKFDQFITIGTIAAFFSAIVVVGSNVRRVRQATGHVRSAVPRRAGVH